MDKVFATVDENNSNSMEVIEFNEMISACYQELKKHEIDTLFKHFDKKGLGKITKEEFKKGLQI